MDKTIKTFYVIIAFSFSLLVFVFPSFANNLSLTNVSLEARTPSSDTLVVEFDVSWENSWKSKINHDAIWLTVRLFDPSSSPTDKKLCQLSSSGLNPTGTSIGSNSNLEVYVPTDKIGAFLRPATYQSFSSMSSTDIQLKVNYSSCGFSGSDTVKASVLGLEMVYVPEGAFYGGDHDTSTASLDQGSSDSDPWYISSASAISVTNPASDGYRYVSNVNTGEDPTGTSFTIPANFPKGYSAFYVMKYEITEAQWIEFFNSLSSAARSNRDLTDNVHKNSDAVIKRNTISCSGSPLSCSTSRDSRAVNYLTWMDGVAFLDFYGLRPMSEMEYEKASRGPFLADGGEFAWGSTTITAATTISGSSEDGTETITNSQANTHYNNTVLTGGDTSSGPEYQSGPLRVGIFATSATNRESAGASYYGTMEFSGNLSERVVTIGNSTGRAFTATHGDGVLSTDSGYEGNATNNDWPGIDATPSRGVTGATGSGYRGGGWNDQSSGARLRISDRYDAANGSTAASSNAGGGEE